MDQKGWKKRPTIKKKIFLETNNCASCQACVQICPHEIWAVTKDGNKRTYIEAANISRCTMDLACVEACPTGAIEIIPLDS